MCVRVSRIVCVEPVCTPVVDAEVVVRQMLRAGLERRQWPGPMPR